MGRYYSGDINGKFWFGIQSSMAAERFGATERSIISYTVDESQIGEIEEELKLIKKTLGNKFKILKKLLGVSDKKG